MTYWISALIYFYMPDVPGKAAFWQMATLVAMLAVMAGVSPLTGVAVPSILGTVAGGVLNVFVMPHLSGFLELGSLLFVFVLLSAYWLSTPTRIGMKAAFIANAISSLSIANEQSYSFAGFLTSLTMITLVCALVVAIFYFLASPRPEKVFLRLYRRLFRYASLLIAGDAHRKPWHTAFLVDELSRLPDRLARCARQIDYQAFPGNQPDRVSDFVSSLYGLVGGLRQFAEAQNRAAETGVAANLREELDAWRAALAARLVERLDAPFGSAGDIDELSRRVEARLARVERGVEQSLNGESNGESAGGHTEVRNRELLDVLGTFRSLTLAELNVARHGRSIDLAHWREPRF